MRKEIYLAVIERLKEEVPEIKHFDLWNQHVEFIEEESVFDMPAVFIEFTPIKWDVIGGGIQKADIQFHLHVVTDWINPAADGSPYQADALGLFDLLDAIHKALHDLGGVNFNKCKRVASLTNHNHGQIMESIETFLIHVVDKSALKIKN